MGWPATLGRHPHASTREFARLEYVVAKESAPQTRIETALFLWIGTQPRTALQGRRMQPSKQTRALGIKALMALLIFLAAGGVPTGLALMVDPSGRSIGLPLSLLKNLPLGDFALVGLWLFFVYGVVPLVIAYGLWSRKRWSWTDSLTRRVHVHWAWMGTVILSLILIIWTSFETVLWGPYVLMLVYGVLGFAMLGLSLLPSVRRHLAP